VAFSRDPSHGENKLMGEFLINAQGEDVVAGLRTPSKIADLGKIMPEAYAQFLKIVNDLEHHYKDMQDVEFTIEEGKLWLLQCRSGKRSTAAALKIAVDQVSEGLITKEQAIKRIDPNSLNQLLHHQPDPESLKKANLLGKGLAASPGAACGQIVFTAEAAKTWVENGKKVIMVRLETSPEDLEGMNVAEGILTARGGLTSHAAVVCRGMGRCCVCGWDGIEAVDEDEKTLKIGGKVYKEGDWFTIIGTTGEVFEGKVGMVEPELNSGPFLTLMSWADAVRKLSVRTNADIPRDAQAAVKFGADGVGLCRTEHMFFKGERIQVMREMILAEDLAGRKKALEKLLVFQKEDFIGLFTAMGNRPVTIRLLDPPLHEFLPHDDDEIRALSKEINVPYDKLKIKVHELHEFNPMLGHRGCRLGICHPEISEMQTRGILEAAAETGGNPEIMIPLVGFKKELLHQKEVVFRVAEEVSKKYNKPVKFMFGTMIEVPRGALVADELAEDAEFFSFGTNDLTQMGCGLSRDDSGRFIKSYLDLGIFENDPFAVLDREGVGKLMRIAIDKGRSVRPHIKLGICGEHGGEPNSVEFCHMLGLNYVSCSPYRVPIARLAAAQAALDYTYGCLCSDKSKL
jgi:pyruvate,orthophosphate dikinase